MTTQDTVATAERIRIGYDEDTAFGTLDTTPTLQLIDAVSEGLKQQSSYQKSRTLADDRMVRGLIRSDLQAGGPTAHEFRYGAFDTWLLGAFMAASWATKVQKICTDAVLTAAVAGVVTIASTAQDLSVFSVGQWVKLTLCTTAANNAFGKVIAASTNLLTLRLANATQDFSGTLTTQNCTITQGEQITNATTFRSFSMELQYTDLSNEFRQIISAAASRLTFGIETEAIPNIGFEWLAKNEDSATATFGDGSPTAASTNEIMNSIDHVKAVLEGQTDDLTVTDATQWAMNLNNNLRARKRLGVLGATSLGMGVMGTDGTFRQHYTSKAIMDKKIDDVVTGLAIILNDGGQDAWGNCYVIEQPSIKFTDGARVAGGQDTDIMADMSYESFKDPTELIVVRMQRFVTADT